MVMNLGKPVRVVLPNNELAVAGQHHRNGTVGHGTLGERRAVKPPPSAWKPNPASSMPGSRDLNAIAVYRCLKRRTLGLHHPVSHLTRTGHHGRIVNSVRPHCSDQQTAATAAAT